MVSIRQWVTETFSTPEPKLFLELGAHRGEDTRWLSQIPGVLVRAFEPDLRNFRHLFRFAMTEVQNISITRCAIGETNGRALFYPSKEGWGQSEWTYSSSLLKPKNHTRRYPSVTFENAEQTVEMQTLDTAILTRPEWMLPDEPFDAPPIVDFIWCDIQGAEGKMIRGGAETLKRTRYLYMEYSNEELYEGQETLAEMLRMLPGWYPIHLWRDDEMNGNVLLQNMVLARKLELQNKPQEVCA